MKILVIEHEANCGLAHLRHVLDEHGAEYCVVGPETERELPESLAGYTGLIVLGGTPGPLEDERAPWLPRTRELMAEALRTELPLLGVCLGGQLLATVAGGRVTTASAPEIGVCDLFRTPAADGDPVFGEVPEKLRALQWHFLEITELPAGSVPLISSEQCRVQAFRVGENAWGTQFHLEALTTNVEDWATPKSLAEAGDAYDRETLIAQMREEERAHTDRWGPVFERWLARAQAPRD